MSTIYEGADGRLPSTLALADPMVVIMAEGSSQGARNNARGHLFEAFIAQLLHIYGYSEPTRERLNVTADGIELDVVATHDLSRQPAIAECKAYSSPVNAAMVGTFHSKLVMRRFREPSTQGFLVALPRLTANAQEQADKIASHDSGFVVLTARQVVDRLHSRGLIAECPVRVTLTSDPAVLITEHGLYAACLELDPITRKPARVLAWSTHTPVPTPVLEALAAEDYAQASPVLDARMPASSPSNVLPEPDSTIVTVSGSQSDFEYQLPASPKYFVGRKRLLASLEEALDTRAGVVVLNAQSGWGKSSAALRLQSLAVDRKGYALIIDSRTATHRRFVTDALSRAAQEAEQAGVLVLPEGASWASLPSALRTLGEASWYGGSLVVFFDQFENVFRDESLTREFRDLALMSRDLADRLLVGFAWKTDLVGWTESHPYQLRDEIRAHASVLTLGPLGAAEVDVLLRRLAKKLDQTLARDLKTRLREYSQGLPWLFKKLAGHLIREVELGATQEQLASEVLNVQNLFDADLAELGPAEQEALKHIARYAPISISEVMERVTPPIVESLVNRRLVVQVGERLDTYWDIFRDYLNTGRIPVEDSYILRQGPVSVARLLREVLKDDGDSSVRDIADRLETSENGVFNLSRDLRLLGATSYEPNRVRILPEIWDAEDREEELRRRVAASLRRHRAYTTFAKLAERLGKVSISSYASELPAAFPAVEVTDSTWTQYARVYLQWFEYGGLAEQSTTHWSLAAEGTKGVGELLGRRIVRRIRGGFPYDAPGPAVDLLLAVASGTANRTDSVHKAAARSLLLLGAIRERNDGVYELAEPDLVADGKIVPGVLKRLLVNVPGVREGLEVLQREPTARPRVVGEAVKASLSADWAAGTTLGIGKHLRGWARLAGVEVLRPPKSIKVRR